MAMGYYGSIDLTKLGTVIRQHPELVRTVNMKDGTQHKFLNIDVSEKQQVDQYGNSAYLRVSCKKDLQRQGVNYYLCDLKTSQYSNGGQSGQLMSSPPLAEPQGQVTNNSDELPF